ncbi:MAG: TerB family tellurite resistance protein [Pseudohongiellaceae bacterium]
MLSTFKSFFENNLKGTSTLESEDATKQLNLACAALMIEVMNSDHQLDEREEAEFLDILKSSLGVSQDAIIELKMLAEKQAKEATSLYEFTRLINDHYDYEQKTVLIENMWRIAFSDDNLDKYEDHLIRKVSELIYVSHSDFIKSKLKVRGSKGFEK